jgi:hypothetical protein
VWCKGCWHRAEPDVADQVERYGDATSVIEWAAQSALRGLRRALGRFRRQRGRIVSPADRKEEAGMGKAGGIIALIAGVFGVIAGFATLMVGGVATVVEADRADLVVGLGWGGVVFSFLTIVLGAVAVGSRSRIPGLLLILCALAGAVLGGTLVAIFMALALIGGILAVLQPAAPAAER